MVLKLELEVMIALPKCSRTGPSFFTRTANLPSIFTPIGDRTLGCSDFYDRFTAPEETRVDFTEDSFPTVNDLGSEMCTSSCWSLSLFS